MAVVSKIAKQLSWLVLAAVLAACETTPPVSSPEPVTPEAAEQPGKAESEPQACQCPQPEPVVCPEPEPVPVPSCPSKPGEKPDHYEGKIVVGRSEYVYIEPGPLKLRARVDSGATTSSLHAADIVRFERDGDNWVRFTTWANGEAEPVTLELPVSRRLRIKSKTEAVDRRVTVEVNMSLGDVTQRVEVSLVDRGDFNYPVLIGRNFLRDVAVIDVSRTFIHGR